jgi:hypothetical protein
MGHTVCCTHKMRILESRVIRPSLQPACSITGWQCQHIQITIQMELSDMVSSAHQAGLGLLPVISIADSLRKLWQH